MGGDHKCLVCGSTFTRPQHVARHMRSHTGDRPYKCSHCGDQFARSDLLSRHVNKCHASEKPPTTTQPARRKGHAQPGSSSAGGVRGPPPSLAAAPGDAGIAFGRRICDACAVSRTPAQCDAGVPCGKCLQRNTKCTYIKSTDVVRRNVSLPSIPQIPSSISGPSSISFPQQQSGDQQHAPQQQQPLGLSHDLFTTPTVPSMAGPRTGAVVDAGAAMGMNAGAMMGVDTTLFVPQQQQAFNFTVPLYPQALDLRAGDSVPSQSTHTTTFTNHTQPHNAPYVDTPSKGLDTFLAGYNAAPVTASDFLYDTGVEMMGVRQRQEDGHGAQDQRHHPGQQQQQQQPNNVHPNNFHPTGVFQFGAHQQPQHSQSHSQTRVGEEYTFSALDTHAPQFAQGTLQPPRPVDGILPESCGTSTNTNGAHDLTATAIPITTTTTTATSLLAPPEGGVWNAFGLMSLDDPIVAAEMSKGESFFAPGALPGGGDDMGAFGVGLGMGVGVTGAGSGAGGTMTPGRDANIAELRDFWKAFMRTPGEKTPGAGGMVNGDTGQQAEVGVGGGGQQGNGVVSRPAGPRRSLSKMTSLPEIKTPPAHVYGGAHAQAQGVYHGLGVAGQLPTDGAGVGGANGREDLRSYEMAVMARQAPTRLTLPRKRATFPRDKGVVSDGQGQGQQQQRRHLSPQVSSSSTSSSPLLSGSAAVAVGIGSTTSGASPSASVISGGSGGEGVGGDGGSGAGSVRSVQSVSGGGGGGADGSGGEESGGSAGHSPLISRRTQTHPIPHGHGRECAATGNANVNVHSRPHDVRHRMHANAHTHARERPSFKRLASQTLGPFESKSVKVSHGSGNGVGDVKVGLELLENALGLEGGNERTGIGKGEGEGEGGKRSSGREAEESSVKDKVDDHAHSASYSHADATGHSSRMSNTTAPGASEGRHHDQQGVYHHHLLRRSSEDHAYREAMEHARRGHGHEHSYAQGQTYVPGLGHGTGDEFYHHQHQQHRRLSAPSQSATRPAFGGGV